MEIDSGDASFPTECSTVTVDFDWGNADPVAKGGRRKKRDREVQKRRQPGTFGKPLHDSDRSLTDGVVNP